MGLLVMLLLLGALVLLIKLLGGMSTGGRAEYPYQKRPALLTPAERSFLGVLEQAVGTRYRVQVQVRLADLMTVHRGLAPARRFAAQSRINGKHADFVLCDPATLAIVAAIELDDASHRQPARQVRDRFVDQACAAAGLPLLRFEARARYSVMEVRRRIAGLLGEGESPGEGAAATPRASPVEPSVDWPPDARSESPVPAMTVSPVPAAAPACPRCGGSTVLRTVRQGTHAGKQLWGCRNFPACRGFVQAT